MDEEKKGQFFLSINFPVYCWLLKREMDGLPSIKEINNFCVVSEEIFKEYDEFRANTLPNHTEKVHDALLPLNDLLIFYMEKHEMPIKTVEIFQQKFVIFPEYSVDKFYEWIITGREEFSKVGFKLFH